MKQIAFESKRGDDFSISLSFKDVNGAAVDITGWTIFFTVKESYNDIDDDAIVSKDITSHSNASQGLSLIALTNEETADLLGSYFFDIQYKDNNGKVYTITEGVITFEEDLSRRTS